MAVRMRDNEQAKVELRYDALPKVVANFFCYPHCRHNLNADAAAWHY